MEILEVILFSFEYFRGDFGWKDVWLKFYVDLRFFKSYIKKIFSFFMVSLDSIWLKVLVLSKFVV